MSGGGEGRGGEGRKSGACLCTRESEVLLVLWEGKEEEKEEKKEMGGGG